MRRTWLWCGAGVAIALAAALVWLRAGTTQVEVGKAVLAEQARQRELRAALSLETQREALALVEVERARVALAELEKPAAPPERKLAEPAPKPAVEVPKTWAEAVRQMGLPERNQSEFQAVRFALFRERSRQRYAPLFRSLNLEAAQRQRFVENLATREEGSRDLDLVAPSLGVAVDDPGMSKLRGEFESDYEKAQRSLLGEDGYAALKEFDRTVDLRSLVGAFAGLAAVEGAPLTLRQSEQLVRVLAENSPSYRKGGAAMTLDVDWPLAMAALPGVLTEDQRRILATQDGGGGFIVARQNAEFNRATAKEKAEMAKTKPAAAAPAGKP